MMAGDPNLIEYKGQGYTQQTHISNHNGTVNILNHHTHQVGTPVSTKNPNPADRQSFSREIGIGLQDVGSQEILQNPG